MQYSQHVTPQLRQQEFCGATRLTISCTAFGKTSNLDEGREGDSTNKICRDKWQHSHFRQSRRWSASGVFGLVQVSVVGRYICLCLDSLICLRPAGVQSQRRGWFPADLFSNALFRVFSVSESLQDKDSSFVAARDFGEKANDSTDSFPPGFSAISESLDPCKSLQIHLIVIDFD